MPTLEQTLKAELAPHPVGSINAADLSPASQVALIIGGAVLMAEKGGEALRIAAARELLRAARRLDPDARLGLDA